MEKKKVKFILINIIYLLLFFYTFCYNYEYDTLNIRRDFFNDTNLNWDLLINKNNIIEKYNEKTGVILTKTEKYYDIMFYPAYKGKDYTTSGRIVYRFSLDRELLFVKVYFLENYETYLLFKSKPVKEFDIFILGRIFKSSQKYNFSIDELKYMPFDTIINILREKKIINEIIPYKSDYKLKNNFIEKVIIPSFNKYAYDGAINEFNEYVSINTLKKLEKNGLNCSGFVKEVIDNYLKVVDNSHIRLPIEPLKVRNIDLNDYSRIQHLKFEFTDDPFFGKDWMDNLLKEFNKRMEKFSYRGSLLQKEIYSPYYKNRGYNLEDISFILYNENVVDPDNFYVIVFNKYKFDNALLPSFYHIAIAVPFFKENHFYIRIFESGEETSFTTLIKNHLPQSFDKNTFEKYLLEKRIDNEEKKNILKNNYVLIKGNYVLRLKNDEEIGKLAKIFSDIQFNDEKVLIYKINISHHFFLKED